MLGALAQKAGPPGAPVAERRVTSVLFADLVGFTTLSESRDAEEVRELLSEYFEKCRVVIGRYGGLVEKFIGDAVMAVWGVPVAHEDDAERAVRAGLELAATVEQMGTDLAVLGLALRVGVVTGEVAVTVGATGQGMVAGDAVNTASRVQSVAEPGRVWVDDTTRELSHAAVTFDDAGEHELKGKAELVRLWRAGVVVAEVGGGQRFDGLEARLTGRESDLRLVKDLFHATEESQRPRLVVIDGEAGIGKSRLAWEFEKYIDGLAALVRWHRGRCLSYGDGVAFWALAEALRARLGLLETDSGEAVWERLDAGLLEFVTETEERAWLRPRLAVLLGAGGGAGFSREDLFSAWTTFLERLAQNESAVVLVIDDAQHADVGLLDFLEHLMSTAQAPIFVLALARPELLDRRPDLGGRRQSVVRLQRLADDAMAALVDDLVFGLAPPDRASLVARSEGIPLFAVETVRALIDRDLVVPQGGRYLVAEGVELDLDAVDSPASLQALVAARLDTLTADERRVVTDASVLGLSFAKGGLLALGSDPAGLDGLLASLQRKEIFAIQTDRFTAEIGQYRFVQSVVRQVAYGTQGRRDRKARHIAAANDLLTQPDPSDDLAALIAQHFLDAAEASSATDQDVPELIRTACSYLERAAVRARLVGSPADAQRLYETALEHTRDPAERAALELVAAAAANDAGVPSEGRLHAQAAMDKLDALGDSLGAALAAAALANSLIVLGELRAAVDVASPRWEALQGQPEADRALLALARPLARAFDQLGEWDALRECSDRMLLLAEANGDRESLAAAFVAIGIRYLGVGAPTAARVALEAAGEVARSDGFPVAHARALVTLAALNNCRNPEAALGYATEGFEVARKAGQQLIANHAKANVAIELWTLGRLTELRQELNESWGAHLEDSWRFALSGVEVWLSVAEGTTPEWTPSDGRTDNPADLTWIAAAAMSRALASGDRTEAVRIAAESFDQLMISAGIEDDFFVLWPPYVEAVLAAGDIDLASRFLDRVTSVPAGRVPEGVAAQWHRFRGLVEAARGGDPFVVESELMAGIDALAALGAVGYRAKAQAELGTWLIGQGRAAEAQSLLEAARLTFREIGAHGWLADLEALAAQQPSVSG